MLMENETYGLMKEGEKGDTKLVVQEGDFWKKLGYKDSDIVEAVRHAGGIWVLSEIGSNISCLVMNRCSQVISSKLHCDNKEWICTAVYVSPSSAVGSRYTWFRREHNGRSISNRLDRGLANCSWRTAFPEGYVENLTKLHFDHCPLLVRCGGYGESSRNRPFRFQATWTTHEEFINVVQEAWAQGELGVIDGLSRVRDGAITFNKEIFGIFSEEKGMLRLEFQNEANRYFQNIFCSNASVFLDKCVVETPVLSNSGVESLIALVTMEEVTKVIMGMPSFKSPGPDGFQPIFFKKYWPVVGNIIWKLVSEAFQFGISDVRLVQTLIVLIPKIANPTSLKELRPISLCNVVYKKKLMIWLIAISFTKLLYNSDFLLLPLSSSCGVSLYGEVSLLWNGSKLDSFKPSRGLRQGDPLSPYLFVLCMEKLALLLTKKVDLGMWQPIKLSRGGPPLSHILFADDVLLFCKATKSQGMMVSSTLKEFCQASRLKVNKAKSKFVCSRKVSNQKKNAFMGICSMRVDSNLGNYLGILLVIGKVMWLPHSVCSDIDRMTMNFLWGGDVNKRNLNLVGWDVISTHKSDGGLGIRDARFANISLLGKLSWNLLGNNDKLWYRVLSDKYLGEESLMFAQVKSSTSFVWRSLLKAFNLLREGFNMHLGEGNKSLWYDNWMGGAKLCNFIHLGFDTQL
ncbi:PREDICTED: uncharacterized protein LOC109359821 [Lupinus angustifolius]|uniref:uncharacterized protein LOC109359821 n=1 Tax=Lupinus angustifolius TaxID=3871 RepID=UPI00092F6E7E|nr:PREDICTED: uncharacterized protein LOC109359821 [Lupinus angustifolius]